jgi:hypothetical protein
MCNETQTSLEQCVLFILTGSRTMAWLTIEMSFPPRRQQNTPNLEIYETNRPFKPGCNSLTKFIN